LVDWRESKTIGTAYVEGRLVWGTMADGLFYCDEAPDGTSRFVAYRRMDWCSPKQVIERRNK